MSEKKEYFVVVKEVWRRGYTVKATSAEEAKELVNDCFCDADSETFEQGSCLPTETWDVWETGGSGDVELEETSAASYFEGQEETTYDELVPEGQSVEDVALSIVAVAAKRGFSVDLVDVENFLRGMKK